MRRVSLCAAAAAVLWLPRSAGDGCPCATPELCRPITREREREVFVFASPGTPNEKVPPPRNDTNWRDLDWAVLTTVAFTGPMEPELICHAHARGVRVLLGWDTGSFCPGWQADSINATDRQRSACIAIGPGWRDKDSPNWLNHTLADLWVNESVRYLKSVYVDGIVTGEQTPPSTDTTAAPSCVTRTP